VPHRRTDSPPHHLHPSPRPLGVHLFAVFAPSHAQSSHRPGMLCDALHGRALGPAPGSPPYPTSSAWPVPAGCQRYEAAIVVQASLPATFAGWTQYLGKDACTTTPLHARGPTARHHTSRGRQPLRNKYPSIPKGCKPAPFHGIGSALKTTRSTTCARCANLFHGFRFPETQMAPSSARRGAACVYQCLRRGRRLARS